MGNAVGGSTKIVMLLRFVLCQAENGCVVIVATMACNHRLWSLLVEFWKNRMFVKTKNPSAQSKKAYRGRISSVAVRQNTPTCVSLGWVFQPSMSMAVNCTKASGPGWMQQHAGVMLLQK